MKNLKQKVAVVTGAGSGIGRSVALQLAKEGTKLALNDFNPDTLAATTAMVKELGNEVMASAFDVAQKDKMYAFAKQVAAHYGQIDIMVNNAGVALGKISIKDMAYKDFEWLMGINFWGMVYGSKAFLPYLCQQKEASLVNISSIFGMTGIASQGAYCSSKFAIRGFNETLRMELGISDPHVVLTSVHPGGIKTNIARMAKVPEGGIPEDEALAKKFEEKFFKTTPEEAAEVILKGIQRKKGRVLIGRDAKFLDFLTRLMPARYIGIIGKSIKRRGF